MTRAWKVNQHLSLTTAIVAPTLVFFLIWGFATIAVNPVKTASPDSSIEDGVTYITYRGDCPYCVIAKPSLRHAAFIYSQLHNTNKVYWVDLNQQTNIAKELPWYIPRAGTIFHKQGNRMYQQPYAMADVKTDEPVSGNPTEYYELLNSVNPRD